MVNSPAAIHQDCEVFLNLTQLAINQVSSVSLGPKFLSFKNILIKTTNKYSENGVFN
jgi:hypothetical protein